MCFDMPKAVNRHEILIDPLTAATCLNHETLRLLIYGGTMPMPSKSVLVVLNKIFLDNT
jgi:hypothetical protein